MNHVANAVGRELGVVTPEQPVTTCRDPEERGGQVRRNGQTRRTTTTYIPASLGLISMWFDDEMVVSSTVALLGVLNVRWSACVRRGTAAAAVRRRRRR